jgi:enoyl-CoA hydratase/carnithine racemase
VAATIKGAKVERIGLAGVAVVPEQHLDKVVSLIADQFADGATRAYAAVGRCSRPWRVAACPGRIS